MKRKKYILAGLCLMSAGIGVAAANSNTKSRFTYYYEAMIGFPSTCAKVVLTANPGCDTTSVIPCNIIINPVFGTRQLFF